MIRVILEGLVKRFGPVAAVDGASLELRPGEMTYVLGPSGAGKTTLARLVAGLETLDDGEIYFGDRMVQALPPQERHVGMVFEDLGLWPGLTVVENVGYPLKIQKLSRPERRRRVAEVLTALRIDSLAGRRPDQLTPPQRLRTALARALVAQPELLLLDSPLGQLDPRAREDCWDDLRRIHAEAGVTILVLTDDPLESLALAGRLALMDLGRIVQVGVPQELYNRPHDVFVTRMLGPANLLQGQVESQVDDQRGEVVVRTPLGRLIGQMSPGQTSPGTPVTISVRPETVSLGPTTPAGWNRFPATIERIIFRGELRQIHARGPGDWPIVVSALQSQSQNLREGQALTLSVAPEHVVVLPGKFAVGKPA
ncbi:MAG TPA: ABC transporter ATP-binding protein [Isosphaeraceae bacterium]|nr:ABC transporter ATP-binding protein [Isosphaeraceae bacterium]